MAETAGRADGGCTALSSTTSLLAVLLEAKGDLGKLVLLSFLLGSYSFGSRLELLKDGDLTADLTSDFDHDFFGVATEGFANGLFADFGVSGPGEAGDCFSSTAFRLAVGFGANGDLAEAEPASSLAEMLADSGNRDLGEAGNSFPSDTTLLVTGFGTSGDLGEAVTSCLLLTYSSGSRVVRS